MASSLAGPSRFGMHSDVLNAPAPDDDAGKAALVEELKGRAKVTVGDKNWPVAEALYTKAIEVQPAAALYGNRSMARFSMGNYQEALADADEAVAQDAVYSKGYYRKGQAASKLKRYAEAAAAYDEGVKLEPTNKLFKKLLAKAQEDAENCTDPSDEPPSLDGPTPGLESDEAFRARMKATGGPVATGPMTAQARKADAASKAPKPSSASDVAAAAADDEEDEDDLKGLNMRGYKKTSDGRTTSFFNNELDEKAKALIGDITPQAIKASDATTTAPPPAAGGSAWNSAGTWEAKNKTDWATAKLEQILEATKFDVPNGMGTICIHKLKDVEGNAEITSMRNKKKYLFDYSFTLEWRAELKDIGPCKGTLKYPDVTPDDDEYDVVYEVDKNTPPAARGLLDAFVRSSSQGIQPVVTAGIKAFIDEYKTAF